MNKELSILVPATTLNTLHSLADRIVNVSPMYDPDQLVMANEALSIVTRLAEDIITIIDETML